METIQIISDTYRCPWLSLTLVGLKTDQYLRKGRIADHSGHANMPRHGTSSCATSGPARVAAWATLADGGGPEPVPVSRTRLPSALPRPLPADHIAEQMQPSTDIFLLATRVDAIPPTSAPPVAIADRHLSCPPSARAIIARWSILYRCRRHLHRTSVSTTCTGTSALSLDPSHNPYRSAGAMRRRNR